MSTWGFVVGQVGDFAGADRPWAGSLRVMGGVLVPYEQPTSVRLTGLDDLAERLSLILEESLAQAGMEWWSADVATPHFLEPTFFARCLLAAVRADVPPNLMRGVEAFLGGDSAQENFVRANGAACLQQLRRVLARKLKRGGCRMLSVAEYGPGGAGDGLPLTPIRDRMFGQLRGQGLLYRALQEDAGDMVLDVLVCAAPMTPAPEPTDWQRAMADAAGRGSLGVVRTGALQFGDAAQPAAQVVDVLLSATTCGWVSVGAPSAERVRGRTRAHLDETRRLIFGPTALSAPEHDAHAVAGRLRELAGSLATPDEQRARQELLVLAPSDPPPGAFPAAVEAAHELALRLESLPIS